LTLRANRIKKVDPLDKPQFTEIRRRRDDRWIYYALIGSCRFALLKMDTITRNKISSPVAKALAKSIYEDLCELITELSENRIDE
jgi:hypothetical protein